MATEQKFSQSTPDQATKTTGPPGRVGRAEAVRRLRLFGTGFVLLAAATIYGGFFDQSIRPDPFSPNPGWWEWSSNRLPHPALGQMPVVPIGARGNFTIRPQHTTWINSPYLEDLAGPQTEETTPGLAAAALRPSPFIATANAQEQSVDPKQQNIQQLQQQQQTIDPKVLETDNFPSTDQVDAGQDSGGKSGQDGAIFRLTEPTPPKTSGEPPRLLYAQCLPGGLDCDAVGEAASIWSTKDGGATWTTNDVAVGDRIWWLLNQPDGSPLWVLDDAGFHVFDKSQRSLEPALYGFGTGAGWLAVDPEQRLIQRISQAPDNMVGAFLSGPGRLFIGKDGQPEFAEWRNRQFTGNLDRPIKPESLHTGPLDQKDDFPIWPATGNINALYTQNVQKTEFLWALGDGGFLLHASVIDLNGLTNESFDLPQIPTPTTANLRSIYFQPDGQIGWISSGWNDGNEEDARPAVLQTTDGGKSWERLTYRYDYAPWVYLAFAGMIATFAGAGVAANDVRRAPPARAGIEDSGASDKPIGWDDPDVLGLQPIAKALSRFLRNRHTEPPLTIAISGPWGTGKSSLMNLVAEDLRDTGTMPVWFNAWHHQKEDHLLAALLENIRRQAIPGWWRLSGLLLRAKLIWMRSFRDLKSFTARVFFLTVAVGAAYLTVPGWALWTDGLDWVTELVGSEDGDGIGAYLLGGAGVTGTLAFLAILFRAARQLRVITLNPAKLMASLSRRASVGQFRDQLGFRHQFASEFKDICKVMRSSGNAGMVIMIDDLDRCRPENVLDILEAVNFLTSAGPCFIFLGIDEEKVISSVAHGFQDSVLDLPKAGAESANSGPSTGSGALKLDARGLAEFSRQYLEKLINITVPVPTTTAENSVGLSVAADVPTLESIWPKHIRRAMRTVPDVLMPLAFVAILGSSAALAVKDRFETPKATTTQTDTSAPDRVAGQPESQPASNSGPVTTQNPGGEPTGAKLVTTDELSPETPWLPYALLLLLLAGIMLWIIGRTMERPEDAAEDTQDFRDALRIWHPIFFLANPSPRGIKRIQNRIRFRAMRLRPLKAVADWLDRVFGLKLENAKETDPVELSDETLVALAAMDALDPRILQTDASPLIEGDFIDRVFKHFGIKKGEKIDLEKFREMEVFDGNTAYHLAVADFEEAFPNAWPPTDAQINAYRGLANEVHD